jgi:hypothetical protein
MNNVIQLRKRIYALFIEIEEASETNEYGPIQNQTAAFCPCMPFLHILA